MKLHKAYRLTHKVNKEDTMTFRNKVHYLHMVAGLKKEGCFTEYISEVVFILR